MYYLLICLETITQIADALQDGYEIIYDPKPHELRWGWYCMKDDIIFQRWTIRLRDIKYLDKTDPRANIILDFCQNRVDAIQAQRQIDRLSKLQGFW